MGSSCGRQGEKKKLHSYKNTSWVEVEKADRKGDRSNTKIDLYSTVVTANLVLYNFYVVGSSLSQINLSGFVIISMISVW